MQIFRIRNSIFILLCLFIFGCAMQEVNQPATETVQQEEITEEAGEESSPEPVSAAVREYARIHQISDMEVAKYYMNNPDYARENPYEPTAEDIAFYERDFLEKMYPGFKEKAEQMGFMRARKFYMDNPPAGPGSRFIGSRRYGAVMQQIAQGGGEGASTGTKDILFEDDPATIYYKEGMRLRKEGRLEEAIEQMEKAAKVKPDAPAILYILGVMYMEKGDNASAIQYMKSSVEQIKSTGFTGVNLAMYADAYLGALTNLGLVYSRIGMYEDSVKVLEEAIEFKPTDLDANYNLVNTYYLMGDMQKTSAQLRKFLSLDPDNAEAHNIAGLMYYRQRLYNAALDEFQTAEKLNPDEKQYSHNLGIVLDELGRTEEAAQAFERASGMEEGDEMRQRYVKQTADNKVRELYNEGYAAMEARRWKTAIEHFEAVIEKNPKMMEAHLNLGFCYRMIGDLENQIHHFEEAAKLEPEMANIHHNLGLAYSDDRRYNQAADEFRKVIELDPSFKDAYFSLGSALFRTGKYAEAAEQFKKYLELDPEMMEAYLNLGASYLKIGKEKEALEQFKSAVKLDPESAEANYSLGVAYRNMGEFDRASELFNKALKIDPAHKQARVLLKELENLQGN